MAKKINTMSKMHRSNKKIKDYLYSLGFTDIYMFPHGRFQKDYHLEECDFDAFGWKDNDKKIWFFQFKTNMKPPKKELKKYKVLERLKNCRCAWVNCVDRKGVTMYIAQK